METQTETQIIENKLIIELNDKLNQLRSENLALKSEIESLQRDFLTRTFNRAYLDKIIKEEYLPKLNIKNDWFYNVYLIDLNNLHEINRKEGYEAGDKYILDTINSIKTIFNKQNASYRIFRIGGDEFLIISQPYDYVDIDLLENDNYEIAHKRWNKEEKFGDVLKYLDTKIIRKKNKKSKNNPCRNCVLRKYPELMDKLLELKSEIDS